METMEIEVEVKNIYKDEKPINEKALESGTAHVYIPQFKLHIKNIVYILNKNENLKALPPFRKHKVEGQKTKVPSVSFDDKSIWKSLSKAIKEAVLSVYKENHPETP